MKKPNKMHQFNLIYLPHNIVEGNWHKYVLTGTDVDSRYKADVTLLLGAIYKGRVSKHPKTFQCHMNQNSKYKKIYYLTDGCKNR